MTMSQSARNLPPISTIQHPSISLAPHGSEQQTPEAIHDSGAVVPAQEIKRELTTSPQPPQHLQHSHSENSALDENGDRNPVHPNAKTTSTTNSANGSTTSKTNISSPVCRNCKTQTTPLWRRDESGQVLCNACGLFLKLHGRPRPISLKTDVIKSRNRVRHTPGPPSKPLSSFPDTPELKARQDGSQQQAQSASQKQKFSPKQYKPSSTKSNKNSPALSALTDGQSPSLVPLLPRGDQAQNAWPQHQQQQQPYQAHTPYINKQHAHHFAQPLHYPSSAPTHFAPNLTKITSPLLLATTSSTPKFNPSQSSERGSLNASVNSKQKDKELAAAALENLSNNDLEDRRITSMKLDNNGKSIPFSPSSALNSGNSPLISATVSAKLPALVAAANGEQQQQQQQQQAQAQAPEDNSGSASPSFGPQFSLSHHAPHHHSNLSKSSVPSSHESPLPPLKQLNSGASSTGNGQNSAKPQPESLPSIHGAQSWLNPISHYVNNNGSSNPNSPDPHQQLPPIQQQLANTSSADVSATPHAPSSNVTPPSSATNPEDVNVLKTRISELELVNDLYRTRIMELEAMENAARQRETALKRRLDELRSLPSTGYNNGAAEADQPERKKAKEN